jgi:hypothetical protein
MRKLSYSFTKDQQNIINYLKEQVSSGKIYFKAKHIGEAVSLSPRSVGVNLVKISKKHRTLKIIAWSEASATTWRIEYNRYGKRASA